MIRILACCQINSSIRPFPLYGSIIGSFGDKEVFFKRDLQQQSEIISVHLISFIIIYEKSFHNARVSILFIFFAKKN